jgi:F-type H+-transporting ATPase subunit b
MPQISQIAATYSSQIFWLLITFGLVYAVIGKTMVPRIVATVDARDARIAGDLAAAEAARAVADQTEAKWIAEMDAARAAAQAETAKAKAGAATSFTAQIKAADTQLAERVAHHDVAIGNAKAEALSNIQLVAAEAAQELVAKLSGRQVAIDQASEAVRKVTVHHG